MSQGNPKFAIYAAKVIFFSTMIFSIVGAGLIFTFVPKFLWRVSQESTVSTANALKTTLLPYLNAGDWNGINQIISSQNIASENHSIYYLYEPTADKWLGAVDSRVDVREHLSRRMKHCNPDRWTCSDLGTIGFDDRDWRVLVSETIPSYSSKNLRIVTAVNTKAISSAASRVMYLILAILLMMASMAFFITRFLFIRTVGRPLESLTLILADEETDLEKLKRFLSQSFFYEISRIGESVNSLWARLIKSEKEREKHARYAAIAQAVQMLAHDIRKPFSMVKITLMILKKSRTLEDMTMAMAKSEKDILRAITHVEGLLDDVMEIDRKGHIKLSGHDLSSTILNVIQDISATDPAPGVILATSLKHQGLVMIDPPSFSRVLGNIITNAIEALRGVGHIHLGTANVDVDGSPFVEVQISNDGPPISEVNLAKLFDPFFTSGKPEGTGLGLAIAKKIIESHGGVISCRSEPHEGVIFSLTVKAASATTHHQRDSHSGKDQGATRHGVLATLDAADFPTHF